MKIIKKFCLSLHYNGANNYLFVNGTEIHKFKGKDSEIAATLLCLGNVSKGWSVDNMENTGLNGYVFHFSTDCSWWYTRHSQLFNEKGWHNIKCWDL